MVDQVYRIGYLRDRVLALLRAEPVRMTAGAISVKLDLPFWAVQAGIDAAMTGDLLDFTPDGYRLSGYVQKVAVCAVDCAQAAIN